MHEYRAWLERNAYVTALLYSAFIAVLLPAFHYVLSAIPGIPADSMPLRLVAAFCSLAVAALLLLVRRLRRFATAFQFVQVLAVQFVIDALVVNSRDQVFYITSGLLMIIGAQNAFFESWILATALACGFAFMALYAWICGIFWTEYNLITLAIYGTGYALALIPASLHIRSQQSAVRSRIEALRAHAELEEAHALTHLGKWVQSLDAGEIDCSPEVLRIFGVPLDTPKAMLRDLYWRSIPHEERDEIERTILNAREAKQEFTVDHRVVQPSGAVRWVQLHGRQEYDVTGMPVRVLGTVMDITARKEAELCLERLARYDALTSLPNRSTLRDVLARTIERQANSAITILFLDLDRFKDINDTLGHSAGDALLKAVAARLSAVLAAEAIVARWGGDEFVVVIPGDAGEHVIRELCQHLTFELAKPFVVDDAEVSVAATIGICRYPADGSDPEVLIRNADTAMYAAKETGSGYAFFVPHMHDAAARRHHVQNQLQSALVSGGFVLHYQPVVDACNGSLVGAEALLRWIDADGAMHPPSEFISIAEDMGTIVPIGNWVLEEAVRQAARWRDIGIALCVAVNVSPRQLADPAFLDVVLAVLKTHRLDPSLLELEITESGLVPNADSIRVLAEIKRCGIRLAVDDFGTGYSTFSYLKSLPLDVLKIDRTFVEGIERDLDRSIVESIVSIGHTLGLQVTAEGVETTQQRHVLAAIGCDRLQGYHIGRPMPITAFDTFAVELAS